MSYPKVPPKANSNTATRLTEERKQRLLKLKEREELKGMLINKFKGKYGKNLAFIDKEVEDFIRSEPLTEVNLKKLDQRISELTNAQPQQQAGQALVKSGPKSVRSVASSQRSKSAISKAGSVISSTKNPRDDDGASIISSSTRKTSTIFEDEDDEWAKILDYDTQLYREEERARRQREGENKTRMKRELERQLEEKKQKKIREEEENKLYEDAQRKNVEIQEQRENQREQEYKDKVYQEKQLRDRQMQEEKKRKRLDQRQQKDLDTRLVQRLKEELVVEQRVFEDKRVEERNYMQKMMQENEFNKKKMQELRELEKLNDMKAQDEYARMLDKQEQDRINEMKSREERQQKLMARMADSVLKDQYARSKEEDMMLLRQTDERERIDREADERRRQYEEEQKKDIRSFLDKQVEEKKYRKRYEKDSYNEQAVMWKQDSDDFFKIEEDRRMREKEINLAHAEMLKMQMDQKNKKKGKMTSTEAKFNKALIKEVKGANLEA